MNSLSRAAQHPQVRKHLQEIGQRRRPGLTEEQKCRAQVLLELGVTMEEIADSLHCSVRTLKRALTGSSTSSGLGY